MVWKQLPRQRDWAAAPQQQQGCTAPWCNTAVLLLLDYAGAGSPVSRVQLKHHTNLTYRSVIDSGDPITKPNNVQTSRQPLVFHGWKEMTRQPFDSLCVFTRTEQPSVIGLFCSCELAVGVKHGSQKWDNRKSVFNWQHRGNNSR
jgi:hypothetical protein